jgi:hypothetical protein
MAQKLKDVNKPWMLVVDENYGEGDNPKLCMTC